MTSYFEELKDADLPTKTMQSGKVIQVTTDGDYGLYKLQFTSGGQLPEVLAGRFTTPQAAMAAVDLYLSGKQSQKVQDKVEGAERTVNRLLKKANKKK